MKEKTQEGEMSRHRIVLKVNREVRLVSRPFVRMSRKSKTHKNCRHLFRVKFVVHVGDSHQKSFVTFQKKNDICLDRILGNEIQTKTTDFLSKSK